ncbi:MAG: PorT family protein [Chlorobi bacterium]|nr:PorT family protein [Chlorobiota bacterium]
MMKLPRPVNFPWIIFTFFILISSVNYGQSVQFKLDLSPRITWFQTNITEGISTDGSTFGYQAGLGMYLFFAPHYAFSSGIHIIQAGGKLSYSDTVTIQLKEDMVTLPGREIMTTQLQYVSLPLGLHFETVEIGYFRFYTDMGINVLYRVASTVSTSAHTIEKGFLNNETRVINITYYGTAGLSYSLGESTALQFGLSYTHGLLDITADAAEKPHDRLIFHSLGVSTSIIF